MGNQFCPKPLCTDETACPLHTAHGDMCRYLTPDEHSFYFNLKGNLCSFYKGKILKIDELNTTKIPDRKTYKNISRYLKTLVIINTI